MILVLLAALAGQTPVDDGVLVIRRDTLNVARETFHVVAGRPGAGTAGWTLSASVRYELARPAATFAPILELGADTEPRALQYDIGGAQGPSRILGQSGRRRFTLRYLSHAREAARELPAGERTVIVDDSVLSFYVVAAWRATPAGTALTALYPRDGRRELRTARDLGTGSIIVRGSPAMLRHVVVEGGAAGRVDVWTTADGHLERIEIPSAGIVAERLAS
jgi:hypothetical protein